MYKAISSIFGVGMKKHRYSYLLRLQYLGFRYSGWQKQPGQKTVEGMLVKTLKFILPERRFKILGAGRTDAKVSALNAAFELFLEDNPIVNEEAFITEFNRNLPPDIRILEIATVNEDFNIIHNAFMKEYVYLFSFGQKNHPFCAPMLANILDELDVALMKRAAQIFVGTHDFSLYTARLQEKTKVIRNINTCEILDNNILKADFFPKRSYSLVIEGTGFMRYQVRMIMGVLIQVGKGELTLSDIERSLVPDLNMKFDYIAPASGLLLHRLDFK